MRLLTLLAGLVAIVTLTAATPAPDPVGVWHGVMTLPGRGDFHMVVKITQTGGTLAGTVESPDVTSQSQTLTNIAVSGDTLTFQAPVINARYAGKWNAAEGRWDGQWTQGISLALDLEKGPLPPRPTVAGLDGDWDGTLAGGPVTLRLVLHVRTTVEAGTVATLDSVDQLANGIAISSISRNGEEVSFESRTIGGRFRGTLSADGKTLTGAWSQGAPSPLSFTRRDGGAAFAGPPRRPQTPKAPYPYLAQDVAFDNPKAEGVRLAGTLTLPQGTGPFPVVVLITGSGPQDRDETLFGHKPFAVIADALTRRGIAVLRYDDRGVGRSTGEYSGSTAGDAATDVEAAIAYLKTRPEIDQARIGLLGHSEGGIIAPLVASRNTDVAFLVLLAAPGVRGDELLLAQETLIEASMGAPAEVSAARRANMRRAMDAAMAAPTPEAASAAVRALGDQLSAYSIQERELLARQLGDPAVLYLLRYDPAPPLRLVKCPVLAINGSKDVQVPAAIDLPGLRAGLAGNPAARIEELPGLNHLFQTAQTGALAEYPQIEETMSPAALTLIGDWVLAVTKRP
ncbi:MAG: alpha/beta fold hydrolase [Caulobacteraceae bacterium]